MEPRDTNFTNGINCTLPAIDDFPRDIFSNEERTSGYMVLHIIGSLYLFLALAVVCDEYFVPAVEKICSALNMSNDIGGATFMAAATSAPELFVNVIGTFITEGDIGVGTIVGSAVFNILAVAACCGIAAGMTIPLDWWPLTRDSIAYGFTVAILIAVMHDERVEWYEALILVSLYAVYLCVMYFDKFLQKLTRGTFRSSNSEGDNGNTSPSSTEPKKGIELGDNHNCFNMVSFHNGNVSEPVEETEDSGYSLTKYPKNKSCFTQFTWILIWPIHLFFCAVIPNCRTKKNCKIYPLTFIMCIFWIGTLSYGVAWMITIIGYTLNIPDSVMGITFLAAGTSVPEAVSSVIVAKRGHGSMGICNSIGSNTFDILICLGVPWLIKALFFPMQSGQNYVAINSSGLVYSAITLLTTLWLLYVTFLCNNFKLDKRVGLACLILYLIFLLFAMLMELNVFFDVNLPPCSV
ncbi:hypothetical protein ACFFRR_001182 [Megaselia abdita]